MPEIDELLNAARELRGAAKDVVGPGGWENADALDGAIVRHLKILGADFPLAAPHLANLRRIVWEKCDAWQKARAQEKASGPSDSIRLAAHQDAEDLVSHSDALLAALQPKPN